MPKKNGGYVLCVLGFLGLLISLLGDFLRGRPIYFGTAQIVLLAVSLAIIGIGVLLVRDIKVKVAIQGIIRAIPYKLIPTVLVFTALALLFIYPLHFLIDYLAYPFPFEYRDAASISAAVDFARGVNPYTLQNYPGHMYLYGLMYPLILSPFINLTDHPILTVKVVDVFFLILFLGLSFWIFRKRSASIISSLIGVLILLNSTFFIWKINGLRPDMTGMFFVLLSIAVLLSEKPGTTRVFLSAFFCVVSLYFKQYMFFSVLVIALYLFLFISKRRGLIFISAVTIMTGITFLVIRSFFPLYYEYSVLHHIEETVTTTSYLELQIRLFLRNYWILILLYLVSVYKIFSTLGIKRLKQIHLVLNDFEEPLIRGGSLNLFDTGIIVSVIILTLVLGQSTGNDYTYFGELLLPFLVYSTIPKIDILFNDNWQQRLIQVILLVFCVFPLRTNYITDFAAYQDPFIELSKYADRCTNIYDETPLVALHKLGYRMNPIYNNGHSEYAESVIPDKETFLGRLSNLPYQSFNQRLLEWNELIESKINSQKFDCIFSESEQEIRNYKKMAQIENVLGRTIYFFIANKP